MIKMVNVKKTYPKGILALEDVNLSIGANEFVSIVGASGAGKSTLIRLMIAEERPSEGKIFVNDRDISHLSHKQVPYYRRKIGVVFQDFKLLDQKTVGENIAFAMEVSGMKTSEIKKSVPKILKMVGLLEKQQAFPKQLSGGEIQRVAIARALVHQPKLLIADEPTGNLDPGNAWEIIQLLLKINQFGTTVILATHNKEIVDALQKRVVTLKDGHIIKDQKVGRYSLKK
ncbi:cell division ATP-binding protein FtsE [Patescibacteria group bacterium]|nr:cell division ATP-binding protein FtsE [Patescibacteria group bacterium]